MTNTQHTPGPWVMDDEYGTEIIGSGKIVAVTMNQMLATKAQQKKGVLGFDDVEQIKANARLIAAAPELLEALERMVLICEAYNGLEAKKARAVIAKAKGEV